MKISLVLSGGGARGYAHIGVIEELKNYGFDIVSISGTSMGAVIGGAEACGKLDEYKKWVTSLDFLDLFRFYKPPMKLDGDKIFNKLKHIIGSPKIEDLDIKYTAVATDLTKKKEVWFQRGDLITAIKASSAIPGVFEPVKIKDRILVDGGVLNLMPVAPVMSDMSDLIIAVNLYGNYNRKFNISKEIKKEQNLLEQVWTRIFSEKKDTVNMSIDLMMEVIFRYRKAEYTPDIEITIPQNAAGWQDFHKALELIEIGKIVTKEAIDNAKKEGIIS